MALIVIFVSFIILLVVIKLYIRKKYAYWKRKNIAYFTPTFPFGNMENPFSRKHFVGEWVQMLYTKFKEQGTRHAGIYTLISPVYLPIDPKLIKNIMQSDFYNFNDRGFYYNEKDDPLSAHLFAIGGNKWKHLRVKLTPAFNSGNIKKIFDTLMACTKEMEEFVKIKCVNNEALDIKDVLSRLAANIIGSCALGIACNSFQSSEFCKIGLKIFSGTKLENLKFLFSHNNPEWARKLGLLELPRECSNFFFETVANAISYRENNNISRNDILQILIDEKNKHNNFTVNEIAAQALIFFLAGYETSSTTMSFCLYELASNEDIQNRVRKEINFVLDSHNGELTYDVIMSLKYTQQVLDETLRKYPPGSVITRKCTNNYLIPDTDIVIEKGTSVVIPVLGLHRDPEYYPDPEKFDPERFSVTNKSKIVPFTYMPFGKGPRTCLGLSFALLEIKLTLCKLLRRYKFTVNEKTSIPLELDKYNFVLSTNAAIWLNIEEV
ncbi:hypothetical protein FQA39_LY03922 [Lamprigera yunnana]|nr:hypothetical protein FQA39_LY03922 [Lamprigera yunnana]